MAGAPRRIRLRSLGARRKTRAFDDNAHTVAAFRAPASLPNHSAQRAKKQRSSGLSSAALRLVPSPRYFAKLMTYVSSPVGSGLGKRYTKRRS
jgi:hypothetical protein